MPVEILVEKEPITVILSQKGWIRCVKGHVNLNDDFKFKDDDALQCAIHAQTTDKIILFDTSGKFFNISGNEIPSGRGFGQPLRLMVDLGINDNICEMFVFEPKASYVIASNSGKGFVVDENHLIAQTRNGRKIMNMAEGETASFCRKITGDMIAVVGDNRKMLIFKIEEIPTMARGRGVTLQNIKTAACRICRFSMKRKALPLKKTAAPKPKPNCSAGWGIGGRSASWCLSAF